MLQLSLIRFFGNEAPHLIEFRFHPNDLFGFLKARLNEELKLTFKLTSLTVV